MSYAVTLRNGAVVLAVALTAAACARRPVTDRPPPPPTEQPRTTPGTGGQPVPPVTQQPTGTIQPGSTQDFVVNVGDRVYFDFDSYAIRAEAEPRLEGQAAWLRRYPEVRVRIEGNADERGTREYNLALGARRAESVRSFLVARGIAPSRIDTISYGKERPIADGSNEEAWARNRNAHTAITSGAR
ncbi:peptidoglycan-associated lipoprotein Pal [Brevundimonas sp. 2R-24]|uniref:Peptidoglycan-associated protein n=1 Tax=Peiella sedimenti TaxID=3061083 RepID=A0ABT8SP22_9CAUL|nr:peptidoglycan-associated lipoprotein Pal [Caulobacteraceae bacterium XZ-24]